MLAFVTACVSPPPKQTDVDTTNHQAKLATFSSWKIKGRLAFKSDKEKFSSYINWQQMDDEFLVKLSSTLGITVLEMQSDAFSTILEVDDKKYQGINASKLIQRVTGWNIPISSFPRWVKGQVANSDDVIWSEDGLVSELKPGGIDCSEWLIRFSRYKQAGDIWLPHQIELQNKLVANNSIKIRISSWTKT